MIGEGLRSGELAAAAGVNPQTLRYYERRGLLAEPERTPGGHRLYPPDAVTLLGVIKAAQRLGFTLDEVADLLDTGRRRHPAGALKERALAKLDEINSRIRDLETIRAALVGVVEAGCDSLTDCTCPDCPLPYIEIARRPPGRSETIPPGPAISPSPAARTRSEP
ncbi:DNA-binding transcriptional regulator, MerR family [Parafrankia irregularis]|uniref:DNA-binding transcriptional regulator, MerR family n=1 Tax=Parafrankia irregularis TaxID=795642 RepID=A0A0S4QUG3_9ACTN|nr:MULTISPECIES: MerR family transcriptional regulator [Parafrankia]MBE3201557.1 MerR family transcriptional regulator [Parafrankia sp. CH37]CUU59371.1 DNA-binding transcriptional regulator, MerR family [Parafrankia irregularis]